MGEIVLQWINAHAKLTTTKAIRSLSFNYQFILVKIEPMDQRKMMLKKTIVAMSIGMVLTVAGMPSGAQDNSKGDEMQQASCGGVLDLFAAADPKSTDNKQDLAAAQDRTYNLLMWVNGYLSGRDGIDFSKRPLNLEGVTQLVADIYKVCNGNDGQLFLNAVRKIR